jgi:hypothetical protein
MVTFASPFGTIDPPNSHDFSYIELPSDEAILEAIIIVSIPWKDLHCGLCFLPFWDTFQVDYRRDSWSEPSSGLYLKPVLCMTRKDVRCHVPYCIVQVCCFHVLYSVDTSYFVKFISILDLLTYRGVLLALIYRILETFFFDIFSVILIHSDKY